jgi:hypothetical protein
VFTRRCRGWTLLGNRALISLALGLVEEFVNVDTNARPKKINPRLSSKIRCVPIPNATTDAGLSTELHPVV